MIFKSPGQEQIPLLRCLWKQAFGDTEEYLDAFFGTAFLPERSLCAFDGEVLTGMLFWFDVSCEERKMAYLYAVATAPEYRGRGVCRQLMSRTQELLRARGYAGAMLVPVTDALRQMYASFGYSDCTGISETFCAVGTVPAPLHRIDTAEYARLRRQLLPAGGVVQEKENLAFLQTFARFFAGEGFLLAADLSGEALSCIELLGNSRLAPEIVAALGKKQGSFRCPGNDRPFAMFLPLQDGAPVPTYFGLAFD